MVEFNEWPTQLPRGEMPSFEAEFGNYMRIERMQNPATLLACVRVVRDAGPYSTSLPAASSAYIRGGMDATGLFVRPSDGSVYVLIDDESSNASPRLLHLAANDLSLQGTIVYGNRSKPFWLDRCTPGGSSVLCGVRVEAKDYGDFVTFILVPTAPKLEAVKCLRYSLLLPPELQANRLEYRLMSCAGAGTGEQEVMFTYNHILLNDTTKRRTIQTFVTLPPDILTHLQDSRAVESLAATDYTVQDEDADGMVRFSVDNTSVHSRDALLRTRSEYPRRVDGLQRTVVAFQLTNREKHTQPVVARWPISPRCLLPAPARDDPRGDREVSSSALRALAEVTMTIDRVRVSVAGIPGLCSLRWMALQHLGGAAPVRWGYADVLVYRVTWSARVHERLPRAFREAARALLCLRRLAESTTHWGEDVSRLMTNERSAANSFVVWACPYEIFDLIVATFFDEYQYSLGVPTLAQLIAGAECGVVRTLSPASVRDVVLDEADLVRTTETTDGASARESKCAVM